MEQRRFKLAALALVGLMAAAPLAAADSNEGGLDVQTSLEDLRSSLGSMAVDVNDLKAAQANAIVWGFNTDLRYDYSPYKYSGGNNMTGNLVGMYAKRVELEATGKMSSWAVWNLQFEAVGLKLEDLGVDAKGLDLLPFVPVKGYDWEAKVGLYRQPFGIENQMGSSGIAFPERAIIDGGYDPTGSGVKIVFERVMGVQMITAHNYGAFGYKLQAAVADSVNDQDPGSPNKGPFANGTVGSLGLTTDQDPSEMGRLGVDLNFIPGVMLNVGASVLHDSKNSVFMADSATTQAWNDNVGYDFTLQIPMAQSQVMGEWVAQNQYGLSGASDALTKRVEGWYVVDTMKPLAFFDKDLSNVELSGRWEKEIPNVIASGVIAPGTLVDLQATTIGLKYLYSGKNYTSVNYSCYAKNGNFTAFGPDSLFSVQQQFNF